MVLKIGDQIGGGIGGALGGAVIGVAAQVVSSQVSALFLAGRSIGGIIPDVTIRERMSDKLVLTDHPVEQGAPITDHFYKMPSSVHMDVAWSSSKSIANGFISGSIFSGDIVGVNDIYRQLLALQAAGTPFDLTTGKRVYNNMVLVGIDVDNDKDTENALFVSVEMRQVNIVQTTATALASADDQASPQDTAAAVSAGTKQPIKAQNQSALFSIFGGN